MSWSELERLVDEAEADAVIRRSLRRCRSRAELVLASRRLGYRITRLDLWRAWRLHGREQQAIRRQEPRRCGPGRPGFRRDAGDGGGRLWDHARQSPPRR